MTRVYADLAAEGYLVTSQGAPTRVATAGAEPRVEPFSAPAPSAPKWSLEPGRPDPSLFPRDHWLAATRRLVQSTPNSSFDYGDPAGAPVLRETLATYLGRSRGVRADPSRIVVCAGFTHAITVLGRALLDLGLPEMAFEDPSFPLFRDLAAGTGQRVRGVPVDEDGLMVSELDSPAVVVTPAHQFPLGVTLAPGRRTALVRSGSVVIEDDYDGEFRFDRHQVGALQALAPEQVVYAGTASKTLSPSLRLAWLVLPGHLVGPVRAAIESSGARPPTLDQLVLADLISTGAYDRHVRRSRVEYRSRRDRLVAALPAGLPVSGISAGLHLVVPLSLDAEASLPAVAGRHSLGVAALSPLWMDPGRRRGGVVVGYGASSKPAFAGALEALLAVLRELTG